MDRIYLDHNATTPVGPAVLEAMLPFLSSEYGNASSVHSFGQRARGAVEHARGQVAALIGAKPAEIVFTSGGTESDNAAIFGVVAAARTSPAAPCHVITTAIEHHAVLHACQALERRGVRVTYVPVSPHGVVDPDEVRRAISPETVLISVMHANNELGTLQPVEAIAAIAAEAGVRFHTDAVQAAGKVPLDVSRLGADLLSLSGHKFGAPKGVGALFVRRGTRIEPLLYGGRHEHGLRAGTENVAAVVALGAAAELACAHQAETSARVSALRDRLEQGLLARIPGARVNGAAAKRVPNTCNLLVPSVDAESLVIALDLRGLACSAGAACSSGATDPSHVLAAIGLAPEEARSCVRFSLGPVNREQDIERALELIPAAIALQRGSLAASPDPVPAP